MLLLNDFDGVSSHDAMGFDRQDSQWTIVYDLLSELCRGMKSAARKRKVRKWKAEILPRFPNTLICPQCLHSEEKT
jgi:hypothetical protein